MSQVTRVNWVDNNTLVSTGQDSCVRQWNIRHAWEAGKSRHLW